MDAAIEEATRQGELYQGSITRRLGQIEQFEGSLQDTVDDISSRKQQLELCKVGLSSFAAKSEVIEHSVEDAARELQQAREAATRLERNLNAIELSRREAEIRRENLEDRSLEELEIDIGFAGNGIDQNIRVIG